MTTLVRATAKPSTLAHGVMSRVPMIVPGWGKWRGLIEASSGDGDGDVSHGGRS